MADTNLTIGLKTEGAEKVKRDLTDIGKSTESLGSVAEEASKKFEFLTGYAESMRKSIASNSARQKGYDWFFESLSQNDARTLMKSTNPKENPYVSFRTSDETALLQAMKERDEQANRIDLSEQMSKLGSDAQTFGKDRFAEGLNKAKDALASFANVGKVVGMHVLPRIANGFKSTVGVVGKFGASIARLGFGAIQKRLQEVGNSIEHVTKRFKRFTGQLGRIVVYRAFRAFLGEIAKGFKEGAKNLYDWSAQFENTEKRFKPSVDSMQSSLVYLRNSVAAMIEPLANALAPIVEGLINKFVELINVVNQFFATLTGQKFWTKAIRKEVELEKAANGAGSAFKRQLLAFDEINRLNENSSGGSSTGNDSSGMFDTVKEFINFDGNNFVERIRDAINKGDWKSVGDELSAKVNELWGRVDFEGFASSIGEKINKVVLAYNGLTDGIEWDRIGNNISKGFMGFIDKINPTELGTALSQKIKNVIETAKGFVAGIDAPKVGSWLSGVINGWINNIPINDFFSTLGSLVNKTIIMAKTIIDNFPWKTVASSIGNGINSAISNVNWENLGKLLSNSVHNFLQFIKTGIETIDWGKVGKAVYDCLSNIDWKKIFKDLAGIIFEAIKAGLQIIGGITGELFPNTTTGTSYYNMPRSNTTVPSFNTRNVNVRTAFANGGYPEQGSMFIAGEAGAEFVGNINGRTGVMNTDQFGAVMQPTTMAIYEIGNAIVGAVNNIPVPSVKIGDRDIYRASERGKRLTGSSLVQGAR